MTSDEQAIRTLIETWMKATAEGDVSRVLELMDDDVVFLGQGRPPMRGKSAFADASRAMQGQVRFEGSASIQEVRVFGDWAYCWNELTVNVHHAGDRPVSVRRGPSLSVLHRKKDGRWVVFRDANMVGPEEPG
jgi:uncharacterized protein (TIGR02246 family)